MATGSNSTGSAGSVKTFRGRTLDELLPQIRAELGPDAIILREREGLVGGVGGFFAQRFVEIDARRGDGQSIDIYDDAPEDEIARSATALLEEAVERPQSFGALAPEPVDLQRDRGVTPDLDQRDQFQRSDGRTPPAPPEPPPTAPPARRFETGLFLERLREASQVLPDDGDELTYRPEDGPDPDAIVAGRRTESEPEVEPEPAPPQRPRSRRKALDEQAETSNGARSARGASRKQARPPERDLRKPSRAESDPVGWADALLTPEPPSVAESEPQPEPEATAPATNPAPEPAPEQAASPDRTRRGSAARSRERERPDRADRASRPRKEERPSRSERPERPRSKTARGSSTRGQDANAEPLAEPAVEAVTEAATEADAESAAAATNPYETVRPQRSQPASPAPTPTGRARRPRIEPPASAAGSTPAPIGGRAQVPAAARPPARPAARPTPSERATSYPTPPTSAFAAPQTEPRAAGDGGPLAADGRAASEGRREREQRGSAGELLRQVVGRLLGGRLQAASAPRPAPPRQLDVAEVRAAVTELSAHGASEQWAAQLITAAGAHAAPLAPSLREAAEAEVARRILAAPALPATGAALAFIGAGGSGKTRCTAALASAYRRGSTLAVTVIALENPEGARELKRLLRDEQVPVLELDVERARRVIAEARDGGLVIVDTAACTPTDAGAVQDLQTRLASLGLDAVYVALPATLGPQAARRALASFGSLRPTAVTVTHADETDQLAVAIEIATAHRIPLTYLHSGTDHRHALAPIEPRDIAKHLLP